jgi:excisionase family DNA binding protein
MNDVLFTPIRLNELEVLIQRSVEKALKGSTQTKEPANDILTVREAAGFLNLAVPTLYGMVSKNQIPYMKRSKRLYFSRHDLTEYLKAGRKVSPEERINERLNKKEVSR